MTNRRFYEAYKFCMQPHKLGLYDMISTKCHEEQAFAAQRREGRKEGREEKVIEMVKEILKF